MRNRKRESVASLTTFIIIGSVSLLLFYLGNRNVEPQNTEIAIEHTLDSTLSEQDDAQQNQEDDPQNESTLVPSVPLRVDEKNVYELTHNLSSRQIDALFHEIQSQNPQFTDDLLKAQSSIVNAIQSIRANPEELGYLFLPNNPAQLPNLQQAKQLDVPLKLQKDPQWRSTPYGSDTTHELGENGCAILSLAMVHDYYSPQDIEPSDILKWSNETFYLHNQGTSWNIFHNFAQEFGYTFFNHGNNFYSAMDALNRGEVVVASVNPGKFTDFGHILVIRGYDNGKVYVNDPNDDPAKMFSIQGIDESVFLNEGVNYWSFGKP